ncbi:MAG: DEAD/DEAH box helicase [Actinomycetales bacterium]|nr:DEAD/DEAH box helicase [Actinomycetales bacterium]
MTDSSEQLHPGVLHHVVNTLGWPDLRPLQRAAIAPIRRGDDCLLLAPTAGGKTEAAIFPLLSHMAEQGWQGLSVLVVTPLRALLNNLQPRLDGYAGWVGCRARVWHGDTSPAERASILRDPPQILLTTPESLEAMLVSTSIDHRAHFAHLRAVVIDELHAFAGDDRGWHLLAVLQRLQHLTGRSLQRIGLTATVGNPDDLLTWLQGGAPARPGVVVAPAAGTPASPEITIDYVGSIANAATVIAALHHGEKRLVFTDSRAQAEQLAAALQERGVSTFVSHSSLSAQERRRSEQAFAEARDCVVVATSTLELGIDVGDLDRVIQLDAPRTVASFLQRLGRTGRRAGTTRNCLFLATSEDALLRAAALTLLWGSGFVEPVIPPVHPRHIAAQQLLALALQEGAFGLQTWRRWWDGLSVMDEGDGILRYLLDAGFLDVDGGMAFIGPQSERHFGRRHFMELLSAFTAEPELTVFFGRNELGSVSPLTITGPLPAGEPRLLVLAGRTWQVTSVDFARRRVQVVEHQGRARSRWTGGMPDVSFALTRACRDVLLGQDPPVELSRRASGTLERIRAERSMQVDAGGLVLHRQGDEQGWWTFAGTRANASLVAGLDRLGISATAAAETVRSEIFGADAIRALSAVLEQAQAAGMPMCEVDHQAVEGLKFSAALPADLAMRTLAERGSDLLHARECTATPVVVRSA